MFAVVHTGGRQHKVQEGEYLVIDHRAGEVGEAIDLGPVLLIRDDKGTRVGDDAANVKVTAQIVRQDRRDLPAEERPTPLMGKKIRVFKRRRRKNSRRVTGFRPVYTQVKITEIKG